MDVPDMLARRLVRDGHWERLLPGVYARDPDRWEALVWAGLLAGGSRAVVGGEAAAALWGWLPEPAQIIVWVPTKIRAPYPWRFRQGVRDARGTPDRTTREDTVLDVWPALSTDERMALIGKAVASGVRPRSLLAAAERRGRLADRREFREMLGDAASGAMSVLERLYLRDVERAHGLPQAVRQRRRGSAVTDCEYDGYGLIVELDGRLGHTGDGAFRDMARDNRHLLEGLSTLRFGYADVRGDPCGVAAQVASILTRRGEVAHLRRCRRCER